MYQVISKFVVAKVDRVKEGDLTTICQVHPTVPGPKTITLNQASFVGFVAFIFNSFSGTAVMFFYFAKKEKKMEIFYTGCCYLGSRKGFSF
jgi:hypothetical protein